MRQRDRDFVCGLLVDFTDGQVGRRELIDTGSREQCLQAAEGLIKARFPGNRPLSAAHIVIMSRDEWDEIYDAASGSQSNQVPQQAAMAASRTSLELIASQLRAWLPAGDAAQTTAMAFVRRGVSELVNHVGKDRANAYLKQQFDTTQNDPSGSEFEDACDRAEDGTVVASKGSVS